MSTDLILADLEVDPDAPASTLTARQLLEAIAHRSSVLERAWLSADDVARLIQMEPETVTKKAKRERSPCSESARGRGA